MGQSTGAISTSTGTLVMPVDPSDVSAVVVVWGTYTGAVLTFEGSRDGTVWVPLITSRRDALAAPSVAFACDPNGVHEFIVGCTAYGMVRVRATALTTGTVSVAVISSRDVITYPQTVTNPQYAVPTVFPLKSAAGSINATVIKASAGTLYNLLLTNTNLLAVRYVKLYNKATTPLPASDVPVMVIPVPIGQAWSFSWGTIGFRFTAGIAVTMTTGVADTDTGTLALGDVYMALAYI
jgi:hypothetical protein